VKIFPCGTVGGAKYIKALKAPLPQVPMVPTGGVNLETAADFLRAGSSALGIGGELISAAALKSGNMQAITDSAKQYIAIVKKTRQEMAEPVPAEPVGSKRAQLPQVGSQSPLDQLVVVLVSTRNPLNIGAAARAMSNFGFSQLRVVNPYELAFREAKSAVGAAGLLRNAQEFSSLAEAVADCTLVAGTTAARDRKLDHSLRPLQQGAALIRRKALRDKVALLFGSEKRGLSNEDFSHCDFLIRIPT